MEEVVAIHACLFAGQLTQVGNTAPSSCGRGTAVAFEGGEDFFACVSGGRISQFSENEPASCSGEVFGFAAGNDLYACLFAGSLTQISEDPDTNCGRGTRIGLSTA